MEDNAPCKKKTLQARRQSEERKTKIRWFDALLKDLRAKSSLRPRPSRGCSAGGEGKAHLKRHKLLHLCEHSD
jgi:hypothetical protein